MSYDLTCLILGNSAVRTQYIYCPRLNKIYLLFIMSTPRFYYNISIHYYFLTSGCSRTRILWLKDLTLTTKPWQNPYNLKYRIIYAVNDQRKFKHFNIVVILYIFESGHKNIWVSQYVGNSSRAVKLKSWEFSTLANNIDDDFNKNRFPYYKNMARLFSM